MPSPTSQKYSRRGEVYPFVSGKSSRPEKYNRRAEVYPGLFGGAGPTHSQTLAVLSAQTIGLTHLARRVRALSVLSTQTVAISKRVGKLLHVGSVQTVGMVAGGRHLLTLAVTSVQTVAIRKQVDKRFAVLGTGTATLLRRRYRTLAVVSAQTVGLTKRTGKRLGVASTQTVALTARKLRLVALAVVSAQTVTLAAAHRWLRTLAVRSGGTARMTKRIGKRLAVAGPSRVTLAAPHIRKLTLAVLGAGHAGVATAKGLVATALRLLLTARPSLRCALTCNGGATMGVQVAVYPESVNTLQAALTDPQTGVPVTSNVGSVTFTVTTNAGLVSASVPATNAGGGVWSADLPAGAWPRRGWPFDVAVVALAADLVTQRYAAHYEGIPAPPS